MADRMLASFWAVRAAVCVLLLAGLAFLPVAGAAGPAAGAISPAAAVTIATIAGDPTVSGAATSLGQSVQDVAVAAGGTMYVTDTASDTVRAVSPSGQETTFAGNGSLGLAGDGGPATDAQLYIPQGVAVDAAGDVLISDLSNRVRVVAAAACASGCPFGLASMTAGDIYTVAGGGTQIPGGGVSAASASLDRPLGLALDRAGDLLISDYGDQQVGLVAAADCAGGRPFGLGSMTKGDIYTIAGNGSLGFSGDGGRATSAELADAQRLALDGAGDLLIGDDGSDRVRLVAAADCASGCPFGLVSMTKGDIYTVAGGGTRWPGNAGPATGAELYGAFGVAVDAKGDLLIGAGEAVRVVAAADCASDCPFGLASMTADDIYTVAGNYTLGFSGDGGPATGAAIYSPEAVALDAAGDLLIVDLFNYRVRLVAAADCVSGCSYGLGSMTIGDIYTIAGNGSPGFSGDGGPATGAELYHPDAVAVDAAGDPLISDAYNNRVRLVAAADCASDCPYGLASMTRGDIYTIAGTATGGFSGDGVPATSAELFQPGAMAVNAGGDLLISDTDNNRVRLVAAADCVSDCPYGLGSMTRGDIYTIAGTATGGFSGYGGPATSAEINPSYGLALDGAGDLLISDTYNNRVRLVAAADCASDCPYGLGSMSRGDIYTIAGTATEGFSGDGGAAASAELGRPEGVAVDAAGDVLVSDNQRVRLIAAAGCASGCPFGLASMTRGDIYTVAGGGTQWPGDGGAATSGELYGPYGLAVDGAGNLLMSDGSQVRLVAAAGCTSGCPFGLASMTAGDIYTIAGNGTWAFSGDGGPPTSAALDYPEGVAMDGVGDLLVSDSANDRVRLLTGGVPTTPVNSSPPTISGTLVQGQLLTESHGSWSNGPTGYAYQWEDCDSSGSNCTAIAGATGQTYTLTVSDAGHTIRVVESASRAGQAGAPATSAATSVIPAPAAFTGVPVDLLPPVISGTLGQGQALTESHGSWSNDPTGYAYQWEDCDSSGSNCTPITAAMGQTYPLTASDAGSTIRVLETASNGAGAGARASSAATAVVTPASSGSSATGAVQSATVTTTSSTSSATGTLHSASATTATARVSRPRVSGNVATVTVSCSAGAGGCTVSLELTIVATVNAANTGKVLAVSASKKPHTVRLTVVLAKSTVTVAAGQKKTVQLALNGTGRALLQADRKLKVLLTVAQGATVLARPVLTFTRRLSNGAKPANNASTNGG